MKESQITNFKDDCSNVVKAANLSGRNKIKKAGKKNLPILAMRRHFYMPPAPDGHQGNYKWIPELQVSCPQPGTARRKRKGITKGYAFHWPWNNDDSDDEELGNQVYMRKRMCWCNSCSVGQVFKCEMASLCGEWCGPHSFWDESNTKNWDETWVTWAITIRQSVLYSCGFCILRLSFSLLVMLELTINNYDRISVVMNQVKEQNMKVEPKIIDAEGEEADF